MSSYFRLTVIRLEGVQWNDRRDQNFYVKVNFGDVSWKTQTTKESRSPIWNESATFPASGGATKFQIQLKNKPKLSLAHCVGTIDVDPTDLLLRSQSGEGRESHLFDLKDVAQDVVEVSLEIPSGNKASAAPVCSVALRLDVVDATTASGVNLAVATESARRKEIIDFASSSTQAANHMISRVGTQGNLLEAIGELLGRLKVLRPVIDALSELHPFFKIAWCLTSALLSAAENVSETDQKVIELIGAMSDAYDFVRDVQELRDRATALQRSIDGLLKQTIECCLFIRHYTSHRFFRRLLDVGSREKIAGFEQSLAGFKRDIESGVNLHTARVSMRAADQTKIMFLRQQLSPTLYDAYGRTPCLPDTCVGIRNEILDWVFSETRQNIFWLYGVAGAGKSTISTTIANILREMSCLGAHLFFEREKSEPSSVIRTIAYQLSLFDSTTGSKIIAEIENDLGIGTASSATQASKLLVEPLLACVESTPGPVVIVIDALDECGNVETRKDLMEIIEREFSKLPGIFRFFITSRREADIDKAFSSQSGKVCAVELDCASDTSRRDVESFIRNEMSAIKGDVVIPKDWPWDENVTSLGTAANGLFIWASTAIRMIKNSDDSFFQFNRLVSDSQSLVGGLKKLYTRALLDSGIDWKSERSLGRFRKIMNLLLLSKIPLSIEDIDGLLGFEPHESSELLMKRLQSLVTYRSRRAVSLLHTSFSDFLVSPELSNKPWFIDVSVAQRFIAERCFTIMEAELKFNICNLQSSFVFNKDVPDLADRIESRIPPYLRYACLYWAQHLHDAPYSSEMLDALSNFAHRHLLFWLEVLSLTGAFGRVSVTALTEASSWVEPHDAGIAFFLRDARKLSSEFAVAIRQSTPHIYVSMIPLGKEDSEAASHYLKSMSSVAQVERIGAKRESSCLRVMEGHTNVVSAVTFSPSGKHVASGSYDRNVRVWDINSGEEIFEPLQGHSGLVTSVCFSPDGNRIVSGSVDKTVRVWDARNGGLVLGPLEGHTKQVESVAWSPDETRIASGSQDGTIVMWDATEGSVIFRIAVHERDVFSVAFSPDSTLLASGSMDDTIRIWNATNGNLVFGPFEDHYPIRSVAFSPDGKHVVSGSFNETIKILEVETGDVILTLEGHMGVVMSVAYFPCGSRIVSGSYDRTVTVWDAGNGNIIARFEGHTGWVRSVAYSQDGKYIASGSDDKTIRIWDATATTNNHPRSSPKHTHGVTSVVFSPDQRRIASASYDRLIILWDVQTGNVAIGPLLGHTGPVNCLAFLPDGSRLISGSWDETIRIWDTETGESVSEPLEHEEEVGCITVSPDGATLVSGGVDGTIRVWSVETRQLVSEPLKSPGYRVRSIVFSPNKRFASASLSASASASDGRVIIWNTETREGISEFKDVKHRFDSIRFSPDSSRIVSVREDGSIVILDTESGRKIPSPLERVPMYVKPVISSWDAKYVISVGPPDIVSGQTVEAIRIRNLDSGETVCELRDHRIDIFSLDLSPDGCRLVAGSYGNIIQVWDLPFPLPPSVPDTRIIKTSSPDLTEASKWVLKDDGWICGGPGHDELLMWIPPDLRLTLWGSHTVAFMSCDFSTKLKFTGAAIGERWTECFASPSESRS